MKELKGIKKKKMWAVFSPHGALFIESISSTKKEAKRWPTNALGAEISWGEYAAMGVSADKILVDIKIL